MRKCGAKSGEQDIVSKKEGVRMKGWRTSRNPFAVLSPDAEEEEEEEEEEREEEDSSDESNDASESDENESYSRSSDSGTDNTTDSKKRQRQTEKKKKKRKRKKKQDKKERRSNNDDGMEIDVPDRRDEDEGGAKKKAARRESKRRRRERRKEKKKKLAALKPQSKSAVRGVVTSWLKDKNLTCTVREAVILKTLGASWDAWRRPHSTQGDRTRALHLLAVLIYRLFGPAMFDVRVVLRSGSFDHVGGFPRGQWLDLLYNVDARAMILTALPEELRRTFHESTMTTADIESHFSRIANTSSDSNKPTKENIAGKVTRLDVALDIMRRVNEDSREFQTHSFQWSRKKRKLGAGAASADFNDGKFNFDDYYSTMRSQSKGYATGRDATNRDHAKHAGGQL